VPDALLPYVRAAETRGALKAFAAEGKKVNFQRSITRGEALSLLKALTQSVPTGTADAAAKKFKDVKTAADQSVVSLALEKQWMKGESETMFGLIRPLRGKEGKLLLSRAFQLAAPSPARETITVPIIRIKSLGTSNLPAPKSDMLQEVWNILRKGYLYSDKLDSDRAGDKAIDGLVNSLGDPYTTYMPKEKNDDFKLQMKGEVEGIGATVEMTGGILTIVSPMRDSPAEKAGLQPKDQIISVDGVKLQGLTLDDAVRKVRGPKGSTAVLHIRRDGKEFDVTVTREKVVIPEIEVTYDQNVAIVKLVQFWDTTDSQFRDVMAEIQSKNPRGIILDLRSNPGGLLHAAGVVVGTFLPKGSTFASIMEKDSTTAEVTNDDPVIKTSIPLIVLVNKGSASASEIVAGALQDSKRGKIVGETTYGKRTVQQVVQFTDGSSLKYTVAEWRTPQGRKIDKLGVTPDVVVANTSTDKKNDLQMQKAMELLR
jgi:C-terminal peptidase prc